MTPPVPGPGEVAIDVAFAGVNFADVMARRGDAGYVPAWPWVPGLEVSGHVRELGLGVVHVKVGQRVSAAVAGGGFAEVAIAKEEVVVPVPESVELAAAAAVPVMAATAWLTLRQSAHMHAGDAVLVHSARGGLGSAVAQLARHLGAARLIGTAGSSVRARGSYGDYDLIVGRDEDWIGQIRNQTTDGFDLILDPLGTTLVQEDLSLLRPGGTLVLLGNAAGAPTGPLPSFGTLLGANAAVAGLSHRAFLRSRPAVIRDAMIGCLDLLASAAITLDVEKLGGLASATQAHDLLAGSAGAGKYVVAL